MWAILKHIIDICMELEPGTYVLLKDPNKVSEATLVIFLFVLVTDVPSHSALFVCTVCLRILSLVVVKRRLRKSLGNMKKKVMPTAKRKACKGLLRGAVNRSAEIKVAKLRRLNMCVFKRTKVYNSKEFRS